MKKYWLTVGDLRKALERVDDETNLAINSDENGFFPVDKIELTATDDGDLVLNLHSDQLGEIV